MDPQQRTAAPQQPLQSVVWPSFINQYVHPQLQQLVEMQWKLELSAKLAAILEKLREKFAKSHNICLCQTWIATDGNDNANPNNLEVTLYADPRLGIVLDPLFQDLRLKSCQGPVFFRNSMPGKVWRSGAVQIVQNLRILPPSLHPRSQLSEAALERLAEALYIPIYDMARPAQGQVCVLEVLLSTRATEAMLVAEVISFIGHLLTALHLSLANPVQTPVRRSVLCGRRARAPDSDGEASGDEAAAGAGGSGNAGQQRQGREGGTGTDCAGLTHPDQGEKSQQQQVRDADPHGRTGSCERCGAPVTAGRVHRPDPAVPGRGPGLQSDAATAAADRQAADGAVGSGGTGVQGPGGTDASAHGCYRCGGAVTAVPACSEQPTLPATPSNDGLGRAGDAAATAPAATHAAAAGMHAAGKGGPAGPPDGSRYPGVPRKVRRVAVEGPMQRSKSVVSVVALSAGAAEDDEDEEGGT